MQPDPLYNQTLLNLKSGFHCAEAVALSVLSTFGQADPMPVVRAASAFGGGIAGSTLELCGAFSGGVIALGNLLGRNEPGVDLRNCAGLIKQFREQFRHEFGSLQCRPLLDAQAEEDGRVPDCARITARAASLLGNLLREQSGLVAAASILESAVQAQAKLAPGACPFGGCGC